MAKDFWNFAKVAKFRQIWSHWSSLAIIIQNARENNSTKVKSAQIFAAKVELAIGERWRQSRLKI